MRPPAESALVKVILKSFSLAEKSARADGRNIFRYLLIFLCLPRILLLPLGFSFFIPFFFFHLHVFSLSVVRMRMRDNIEKDFAHVLSNREVIARISNVKYAFEMKKRVFGFTFQLMDLTRRVNRRIERKPLDTDKVFAR